MPPLEGSAHGAETLLLSPLSHSWKNFSKNSGRRFSWAETLLLLRLSHSWQAMLIALKHYFCLHCPTLVSTSARLVAGGAQGAVIILRFSLSHSGQYFSEAQTGGAHVPETLLLSPLCLSWQYFSQDGGTWCSWR
jgi:hypothetical protein